MKVFYHDDYDGRCAAYLLYHYHTVIDPINLTIDDFIPVSYDHQLSLDSININSDQREKVYFLDYHPKSRNDYEWLRYYTDLTVIDHHKSAIEDLTLWSSESSLSTYYNFILTPDYCGSVLTYKYLYGTNTLVPYFLTLLDDYDCWKLKELSLEFYYGLKCHNTGILGIWDSLSHDDGNKLIWSIITTGSSVLKAQEAHDKLELDSIGFEDNFENYRCFCVNRWSSNSLTFKSKPGYDIYISYYYNGSQWSVHMYAGNLDIDVSDIAKKYGGGGHPGSAGFTSNSLF